MRRGQGEAGAVRVLNVEPSGQFGRHGLDKAHTVALAAPIIVWKSVSIVGHLYLQLVVACGNGVRDVAFATLWKA